MYMMCFMEKTEAVGLLLTVLAGVLLLAEIIYLIRQCSRCSVKVDAEITAILNDAGNPRLHVPEYSYEYEGQHYKVHPKDYATAKLYQPGDRVTLRIDPANPSHFFDAKRDFTGAVFICTVLILFLGIGIFLLCMK